MPTVEYQISNTTIQESILTVLAFLCKDWNSRKNEFDSGKAYLFNLTFGFRTETKQIEQRYNAIESDFSILTQSIELIPENLKEYTFILCCYLLETRGQIQDEERLDYIRKQFAYSPDEGRRLYRFAKAQLEFNKLMATFSE